MLCSAVGSSAAGGMTDTLLQGFYLGDLLVEPLTGQVTGRGRTAHLPPTATEVLVCLARNPGDIVARESLLQTVWGDGRGSAEALSHAVSEIRHALGDHPTDPHYIQTLPRRGYRLVVQPIPAAGTDADLAGQTSTAAFQRQLPLLEALRRRGVLETAIAYMVTGWLIIQIADVVFDQLLLPQWAGTFVTVLVIAGFPLAVLLSWFLEFRHGRAYLDTRPDQATPAKRFSRTYVSIVTAMAVASIGVFTYDRFVGLPMAPVTDSPLIAIADAPPVRDNSIAVLPFFNIDGSDTSRIFAHGLAEDVINRLASIPGLAVASRGDSWTLPANSQSADIRRRLRVAYYLEGSVRISDEILRVVVQLIDSSNGFHIVSRDFEKPLQNFHEVQKEITDLTVANLRVALPPDTQPVLDASFEDAGVDAYVLYQRGREVVQDVRTTDSLEDAIAFYRRSLELDPQYAAAHAGICEAYVDRYVLGRDTDDIGRAERSCARALDSNPRLYMVHSALGLLYRNTGRFDDAEKAYNEALRINSQDVQAMMGLASLYRQTQKFDEAEVLLETAIATQPGNWRTINALGTFLFYLGRYEEAASAYRDVAYLDPNNGEALGNMGSALMMAGDFSSAAVALEDALEQIDDGLFMSNLGVLYYYLGRFDDAIEMHRQALEQSPNDVFLWNNLGDALYFANRPAEARESFRQTARLSEEALVINPSSWQELITLSWARQMLGQPDEARALIERVLAVSPNDPYSYYYKALLEVRQEAHDSAVTSLERAVELGYPLAMLDAEPYLEPLRDDSRFLDLLAGED